MRLTRSLTVQNDHFVLPVTLLDSERHLDVFVDLVLFDPAVGPVVIPSETERHALLARSVDRSTEGGNALVAEVSITRVVTDREPVESGPRAVMATDRRCVSLGLVA